MRKFKQNQEISARSVCDHNCIFTATIVKRTAKSVMIKDNSGERRCKIHTDESGGEFIFPYGQYSMAPIMRAQ